MRNKRSHALRDRTALTARYCHACNSRTRLSEKSLNGVVAIQPQAMLYYTGITQNKETQLYQLWYIFEPNFEQLYLLSAHKTQIAALEAMQRLTLVHCNSKPLTCHEDVVKIAGGFPSDGPLQPFNDLQVELIRRQLEYPNREEREETI